MKDGNSDSHGSHDHGCEWCGRTEKNILEDIVNKFHLPKNSGKEILIPHPGDESLYFCQTCIDDIWLDAYEHPEDGFESGKCGICGKDNYVKTLKNGTAMCISCIGDLHNVDIAQYTASGSGGLEQNVEDSEDAQTEASERQSQKSAYAPKEKRNLKVKENYGSEDVKLSIDNLDFHELYTELKKSVIGHDVKLKKISMAVSEHYLRRDELAKDTEMMKKSLLIVGPTGCGKTHIVETIAKILDVPYHKADCAGITGEGYVGGKINKILYDYINKVKEDLDYRGSEKDPKFVTKVLDKVESGILFFDELDSKAKKSDGHNRDISGEDVQRAFLVAMQTDELVLDPNEWEKFSTTKPKYIINPRKILFTFCGAFQKAYDENEAKAKRVPVGFGAHADGEAKIKEVNEDNLENYLISEFIGRTDRVFLKKLTAEDIYKIIMEKKNPVYMQRKGKYEEDYKKLGYNMEFVLENDAAKLISQSVANSKYGARDIETKLDKVIGEDIFNLTEKAKGKKEKIVYRITKDLVNERLSA